MKAPPPPPKVKSKATSKHTIKTTNNEFWPEGEQSTVIDGMKEKAKELETHNKLYEEGSLPNWNPLNFSVDSHLLSKVSALKLWVGPEREFVMFFNAKLPQEEVSVHMKNRQKSWDQFLTTIDNLRT